MNQSSPFSQRQRLLGPTWHVSLCHNLTVTRSYFCLTGDRWFGSSTLVIRTKALASLYSKRPITWPSNYARAYGNVLSLNIKSNNPEFCEPFKRPWFQNAWSSSCELENPKVSFRRWSSKKESKWAFEFLHQRNVSLNKVKMKTGSLGKDVPNPRVLEI